MHFVKSINMENTEEQVVSTPSPLSLDWTDVKVLSQFVTATGRILPRKYTHLSARQQRHVARMIKRARNMLLMK